MSSGIHPPNHHHLICAHDAFFFFAVVVFVLGGGVTFRLVPPPPNRQDRSPPLHPRDGAMTGFGYVKPHVNPTPTVAHTSQCVSHGRVEHLPISGSRTSYVSPAVVGSSGMLLSQQQVSVSFRADTVLHSRVGEGVFVLSDCGLSSASGSYTQSQTDGSSSVLEHRRRMGSLPRRACLVVASTTTVRKAYHRCGFCLGRRRRRR